MIVSFHFKITVFSVSEIKENDYDNNLFLKKGKRGQNYHIANLHIETNVSDSYFLK